jgi:hypothetical protein
MRAHSIDWYEQEYEKSYKRHYDLLVNELFDLWDLMKMKNETAAIISAFHIGYIKGRASVKAEQRKKKKADQSKHARMSA